MAQQTWSAAGVGPPDETPMHEPLHILVVEDDAASRAVLCRYLRASGYTVHVARDGLQALELLEHEPVDILITDWMMPELDGLQLCQSVRAASTGRYIFTILLTCRTDPVDVVAGFSAGADDYVTKPFERKELLARVRAGDRVVRLERALSRRNRELASLLDELQSVRGRLERIAATDPLTGLWNRRHFEERFASELAWAHGSQKPLTLALMDLDHFKQVNDRHGHVMGDEVLRTVARIMQTSMRGSDAVARLGGEEFGILFRGATGEQAERTCERVRTSLAATRMGSVAAPFRVTGSFGVAMLRLPDPPERNLTASAALSRLMVRADRALYAAKCQGRNRTVTAPDPAADGPPELDIHPRLIQWTDSNGMPGSSPRR